MASRPIAALSFLTLLASAGVSAFDSACNNVGYYLLVDGLELCMRRLNPNSQHFDSEVRDCGLHA